MTMQTQFRLVILGLVAGATFGLVWGLNEGGMRGTSVVVVAIIAYLCLARLGWLFYRNRNK